MFNSKHHKSCKWLPEVTQSLYFLQGFTSAIHDILLSSLILSISSKVHLYPCPIQPIPVCISAFRKFCYRSNQTFFRHLRSIFLILLKLRSPIPFQQPFTHMVPPPSQPYLPNNANLSVIPHYHNLQTIVLCPLSFKLNPVCPHHYLKASHKTGHNNPAWLFW